MSSLNSHFLCSDALVHCSKRHSKTTCSNFHVCLLVTFFLFVYFSILDMEINVATMSYMPEHIRKGKSCKSDDLCPFK